MQDQKQQLILLHGALGTKNEFNKLIPKLENQFESHLLNFEGHGENKVVDRPFRIKHFVEDVLNYLDENKIDKANFFGYSMGGYVALTLAKDHPERVNKVATLGTVLQWTKETAEREFRYLDPAKIEEKVPHFAKDLDKKHPNNWEAVVNKTREMLQYLGTNPNLVEEDWNNLQPAVRFHIGDRDVTAGISSTLEVYSKMDEAELSVLPATPHPFEKVNKERLAGSLKDFFN